MSQVERTASNHSLEPRDEGELRTPSWELFPQELSHWGMGVSQGGVRSVGSRPYARSETIFEHIAWPYSRMRRIGFQCIGFDTVADAESWIDLERSCNKDYPPVVRI
jgi:hypothetical protein